MNRLSPRILQVMMLAKKEAAARGASKPASEHILLGLLRAEACVASKALHSLECSYEVFAAFIGERSDTGSPAGPSIEEVLERASFMAEEPPVGTDQLLLALYDAGDSLPAIFFRERNITRADIERALQGINFNHLAKFFTTVP